MTRRPGLALKLGSLLTLAVVGVMLLSSAFTRAYDGSGNNAWVVLALLVALFFAFVAALVLDVLVVRPLVRLAIQVRRMEAQDLGEPFVATGSDEPRELGEALERLRHRVLEEQERQRQMNAELEQRVTERTTALAAAQRELVDAARLASVGRLAGGVAHEINNPAGVILGRASFFREILEEEGADTERIEDLRVIERQAERIRQITGSLLRFARPGTGERRLVDIAAVARESVGLVSVEARRRGITVAEDLARTELTADPHAVEQVIYNLLRNAVHAARTHVRVAVDAEQLSVEDDGAGIAPEHLNRLFEPFFTTKAQGDGSGLGLAVVHGIVQDHGWRVVAENRAEGGARFRVIFRG